MKRDIRLASHNRNTKNPERRLLRQHDKKSTVSDLVYEYLRKVAHMDRVRKQRNNACDKFRRKNAKRKIIHPSHKYTNAENNATRSYICKALSFAVDTGYLIPIDRTGKLLQLSPHVTLRHTLNK